MAQHHHQQIQHQQHQEQGQQQPQHIGGAAPQHHGVQQQLQTNNSQQQNYIQPEQPSILQLKWTKCCSNPRNLFCSGNLLWSRSRSGKLPPIFLSTTKLFKSEPEYEWQLWWVWPEW